MEPQWINMLNVLTFGMSNVALLLYFNTGKHRLKMLASVTVVYLAADLFTVLVVGIDRTNSAFVVYPIIEAAVSFLILKYLVLRAIVWRYGC
jgi:uncharacterized membrane protein